MHCDQTAASCSLFKSGGSECPGLEVASILSHVTKAKIPLLSFLLCESFSPSPFLPRFLTIRDNTEVEIIVKPVYKAMAVAVQMVCRHFTSHSVMHCRCVHVKNHVRPAFVPQVLFPQFQLQGDIMFDPEADWEDDNNGKDKMDFKAFFEVMFELVDKW